MTDLDKDLLKCKDFLDRINEIVLVETDDARVYKVNYRGDVPILIDGVVKLIEQDGGTLNVQADSNFTQFIADMIVDFSKKISKIYKKLHGKKSTSDILAIISPIIDEKDSMSVPLKTVIFSKDGSFISKIKKSNFHKHFSVGQVFTCFFSIDNIMIEEEDIQISLSFIHMKPAEDDEIGTFESYTGESDSDSDSDSGSESSSGSESNSDTESCDDQSSSSSDSSSDSE